MRSIWMAALGLAVGCTTPNPTFDDEVVDTGTWGSSTSATSSTSGTAGTAGTRGTDDTSVTSEGTTSGKTTSSETRGDDGSSGGHGSEDHTSTASKGDASDSGTSEASGPSSEVGTASGEGSTGSGSGEESSSGPGCEVREWFIDGDDDGYGGESVRACEPPVGNVAMVGGDCDDENPRANPGLSEVCGDGVDNDCNEASDELEECAACTEVAEPGLFLCPEDLTWEAAATLCGRFGGHLAVIPDEGVEEELLAALDESALETAWIGLSREDGDDDFTWVGGLLPQYTNWNDGEQVGNCGRLVASDAGWEASPCEEGFAALCQRDEP